ncbi:unnamed protein product, partial [Notodromas monacha]
IVMSGGTCYDACGKNGTRRATRAPPNALLADKATNALGEDATTAAAAVECACQCGSAEPAYRGDTDECVAKLHECEMADFMDETRTQSIPLVILPLEGQLIRPTSRIALADVQPGGKVVKAPVCAVTEAQILSGSHWFALLDPRNSEPPFRLYRDLDNTFLQNARWRISWTRPGHKAFRLSSCLSKDNSFARPLESLWQPGGKVVKAPVCAVTEAQILSGSHWFALLDPRNSEPPFRLYRDLDNTFLQWLGPPSLRPSVEGKLVRVSLMCRDEAITDAADDPGQDNGIFTPCVAFRVSGSMGSSPYLQAGTLTSAPKTSSSLRVGFEADHVRHRTTSDNGDENDVDEEDDGISDYVIIGVCAGIVTLIYVVAVFVYVRVRHLRRLRRLDEQSSLEKAARRQQEQFSRSNESMDASRKSPLLANKEHNPVLKSGLLSGVRSARLTQNTVQGLRQHMQEANAEEAKRAETGSGKSPQLSHQHEQKGKDSASLSPNTREFAKNPGNKDKIRDPAGTELRRLDEQSSLEKAARRQQEQFSRSNESMDASRKSPLLANKEHNPVLKSGLLSGVRSARLTQNTVQGLRQHLQEANAEEAKRAETGSGKSPQLSHQHEQKGKDSASLSPNTREFAKNPGNKDKIRDPAGTESTPKAPPPGAIEFLNRVREMMALAKNRMDSKRYEPSLQEIPEESSYESLTNVAAAMSTPGMDTMLNGAFDNPAFTLEASAAEIQSFLKLSDGILRNPRAFAPITAALNGDEDKVHRWLQEICNHASSGAMSEEYPNSYDSGVSTGDGSPDSLNSSVDKQHQQQQQHALLPRAQHPLPAVPSTTPARLVVAAPGVRPPRKRNPKYETTPAPQRPSQSHLQQPFQPTLGSRGSMKLGTTRSSVDRVNEILSEAEAKMPKMTASGVDPDARIKICRSNSIGAFASTGTCKLMIEVPEASESEPESRDNTLSRTSSNKAHAGKIRRKLSRKESFLDSLERPKHHSKLSQKPSIVQDSLERASTKRRDGSTSSGGLYKTFGDFKRPSEPTLSEESDAYNPIEIRSVPATESPHNSGVWRENSFLLPNYWQRSFKSRHLPRPPSSFAPDSLHEDEDTVDDDASTVSGSSVLRSPHHQQQQQQSHEILRRVDTIAKDLNGANGGLSQGMLIALNLRSKLVEKYGKDFEKRYFGANATAGDSLRTRLKKLVRTESCDSILKDSSGIKKYKSVDEVLAQLKQCSTMCSTQDSNGGAVDPAGIHLEPHLDVTSLARKGASAPSGAGNNNKSQTQNIRLLLQMLEDQKNKPQQQGSGVVPNNTAMKQNATDTLAGANKVTPGGAWRIPYSSPNNC